MHPLPQAERKEDMSLNKELVKQLKSYADKDWHRDQLFSSKVISDVAEEWLAKDAEIATLKAEIVNREGEKQEMREVIDRLKAELESYKRAKAENDERFQLEAGALRLDLEREREANTKLREALEVIATIGTGVGGCAAVTTSKLRAIARQALLAAKQDEGK